MIDEQGKELKNSSWALDFHKAYSSLTSKNERASFLHNEDLLTRIATIWGASNANQTQILEEIYKKERESDSWEIQASIATSPHCNPDYLHHITTGIGKEIGHGYILRIVSRNPNVRKETLETIVNDPKVEPRYTQCAKAALEHGKDAANHQI